MILFSLLFILSVFQQNKAQFARPCDSSHKSHFEGNLGETASFPWLGVLRVHLHDGNKLKIAITGIVYIKEKYAIGNADDIGRIPQHILKQDSQAMFIPTKDKPWYCKIKDVMNHPEYQYATVNTISILELDMNDDNYISLPPICIPGYSFNASDQLYAAGFTDEKMLLEKTLYKLQYVNKDVCDEFYSRAKLSEGMKQPKNYLCGFAVNNKKDCVWENGMVLASNSTGKWHLIGLSIKGPGCAAPTRFIDVIPYFQWVESIISMQEPYYEDDSFRRHVPKKEIEDIPVHELFRASNKSKSSSYYMFSNRYPFNVDAYKNFDITRIAKGAIYISAFDSKYEKHKGDCDKYRQLVYHDKTRIVSPGKRGTAAYKLTLYDMMMMNYTCVKMEIKATNRSTAYLYYKTYLDLKEDTSFSKMGETPEEIIKVQPIDKLPTANNTNIWKPNPNFKPQPIEDQHLKLWIPNVNLIVQMEFMDEAILEFYMYGEPKVVKAVGRRRPEAMKFTNMLAEQFVVDEYVGNSSNVGQMFVLVYFFCFNFLLFVFLMS